MSRKKVTMDSNTTESPQGSWSSDLTLLRFYSKSFCLKRRPGSVVGGKAQYLEIDDE